MGDRHGQTYRYFVSDTSSQRPGQEDSGTGAKTFMWHVAEGAGKVSGLTG